MTGKPAAARKTRAAPSRETVERKTSAEAPTLRDVDTGKKIKVLCEGNPRREGSVTYDHFKKHVKDGLTVQDFLDKGGNWLHLRADIARGHVKLV